MKDRCAHCGAEFDPGADYCPNCGKALVREGKADSRALGVFWQIARGLVVVVLVLVAILFGLAGACGVYFTLAGMGQSGSGNPFLSFALGSAVVGFGVAALCFWGAARLSKPR